MTEKTVSKNPERTKLIIFRWLSVVSCGAVAAGVWIVLQPLLEEILNWIVAGLGSLRGSVLVTACLVLGGAALWKLGHGRWLALTGLSRYGRAYPPLWFASIGVIAVWLVVGTDRVSQIEEAGRTLSWSLRQLPIWVGLGLAIALMTEAVVTGSQRHRDDQDGSEVDETPPKPITEWSIEEIVDWLKSDKEIDSRKGDLFGHHVVADRIYSRLSIEDGEAPTIAVVGPLGSGKSTIRGLVEARFKRSNPIRMVSLSVWPFDTPEAAVDGILNAIIRALHQEVGTLALTGLPDKYIRAVEHAAGSWRGVVNFLQIDCAPEALIERLDKAACTAGIRIVLWVEDMERFSGSDQLSGEAALKREAERLGPIRSLLYLLDRCSSVTVVLSDASLRSRFDVSKIARFVEAPPRLQSEFVWGVVAKIRLHCLNQVAIDPASKKHRNLLSSPPDDMQNILWLDPFDYPDVSVPGAIALLLSSPRELKMSMRIAWETWEKLKGEIDFDSMLAGAVIKSTRPNVFSLVDREVDLFRIGMRSSFRQSSEDVQLHPVEKTFEDLLGIESDKRMQNAVKSLVIYMFPAYCGKREARRVYLEQPQGLCVNTHADYWQRFNALPVIAESEGDQLAILVIRSYLSGESKELVDWVIDGGRSARIQAFVNQFRPTNLCRLLVDVVETVSGNITTQSDESEWVRPIKMVSRMMEFRRPCSEELGHTVSGLIDRCESDNIPLIHILHHHFGSARHGIGSKCLHPNEVQMIRESVSSWFRRNFSDAEGPKKFIAALRNSSPFIMVWICEEFPAIIPRSASEETDSRWQWISTLLLQSAKIDPLRVLPIVVSFFVDFDHTAEMYQDDDTGEHDSRMVRLPLVNVGLADRLFGLHALRNLLQNFDANAVPDEYMRDGVRQAQIELS